MKALKNIGLLLLVLFGSAKAFAQPYSLDKKLEPMKLTLEADTRVGHEGEKGVVFFNRIDSTAMLHYVSGHDMYQMVDILVSSIGNTPLKVMLVRDSWDDMKDQKSTVSEPDSIAHFKVRAYGPIGIKIESKEADSSLYNITVLASKPIKEYLGSPFRKIKDDEMKASKADVGSTTSGNGGGSNNTFLYIALGVALLIIGLLAGKLMGNKGKGTAVILAFLSFSSSAYSQQNHWGSNVMTVEQFENWRVKFEHDQNMLKLRKDEIEGYKRSAEKVSKNIKSIYSAWASAKTAWAAYMGLGACMNSAPPAGEPNIPSFCDIPQNDSGFTEGSCAECYFEARKEFNEVRYLLEKLATIYKCTKDMTDASLSLGDNASGIHAVTGLAWQYERRKIEQSIKELEVAYDSKYAEFMQRLADAMQQLNICEAKFGVEDWYDRFGYIYYEFMKDKYRRK